jgi:hypothetical protein
MKNPLKPTYRERERAPDKFEMEHNADLQMMLPDFDDRLRAHEEKHDPLNEFTGHSAMTGSAPVTANANPDVTVALTGVVGQAKTGTVYVLQAKTGHFTISGPRPKMSPEREAEVEKQLSRIAVEAQEKHKLQPTDMLTVTVNFEPEIEPTVDLGSGPLLEGAERFVSLLPDPKMRKMSLKRIADDEAELQVLLAEGRTKAVMLRKAHLWAWLLALFASYYVLPVARLLAKVPAWVWAFIVWLFTWKH